MKFCSEREYKNKAEVEEIHPEAAKILKVEGGWGVFATYQDYDTWKKQK